MDETRSKPAVLAKKRLSRCLQERWRLVLVAALAVTLFPFAARGPAAGASQLLALLQDPAYPAANKAVAAQAVWVLFASAPWIRDQVVRDSDGIELWIRLMHLQNAALVERSAAMAYSTLTHQPEVVGNTAARRLAAAMTLPLCSTRCQGSLILSLGRISATQPAALQTIAQSPALSTLVDWSGISCNHSSHGTCPPGRVTGLFE